MQTDFFKFWCFLVIWFLLFDSFSREEKDRNLEAVSVGLQPLIIGFFRVKRHVERFVTQVTRRSSAVALGKAYRV